MELNRSLTLSCPFSSQRIHLNRLELFYDPTDPLCLFPSCCDQRQRQRQRTSCSRRLTKYFSSSCNDHQQCSLTESCSTLSQSCTQFQSVQGQVLHIDYSCRTIPTDDDDEEEEEEEKETVIVKLLTFNEEDSSKRREEENSSSKDVHSFELSSWKSSPLFLFLILCLFCVLMIFLYWLSDELGERFCRQPSLRRPRTLKYVYLHYDPRLNSNRFRSSIFKTNDVDCFA